MKPITVKAALKKLAVSKDNVSLPEDHAHSLDSDQLMTSIISLQQRTIETANMVEALIDIFKVFDIINLQIFEIAMKNVMEFHSLPGENEIILEQRALNLKAKLKMLIQDKGTSGVQTKTRTQIQDKGGAKAKGRRK